jgi:hypothetical protein
MINSQGIINRVVERNMNTLGIKPFNPAERLAGIRPEDRDALASTMKSWYAQNGVDPLQSEGMIQQHLTTLMGG